MGGKKLHNSLHNQYWPVINSWFGIFSGSKLMSFNIRTVSMLPSKTVQPVALLFTPPLYFWQFQPLFPLLLGFKKMEQLFQAVLCWKFWHYLCGGPRGLQGVWKPCSQWRTLRAGTSVSEHMHECCHSSYDLCACGHGEFSLFHFEVYNFKNHVINNRNFTLNWIAFELCVLLK